MAEERREDPSPTPPPKGEGLQKEAERQFFPKAPSPLGRGLGVGFSLAPPELGAGGLFLPIKLIAVDVDGTLTDGVIQYDTNGAEHKRFHVADGLGIVMAQSIGLRFAVITGRRSPVVERRMTDDLKVADVVQKCGDKAAALRELMEKYGLQSDEVAYIGDDINDLPAFGVAGVKIAVADAAAIVLAQADFVTERPGGQGAVREAIDLILQAQGRYEEAIEAFLAQSRASGEARQ